MIQTIYLMRDPLDGGPRYVGVTSRELKVRITQHAYQARSGEKWPVHVWHRKLQALGLSPIVEVLEITEDRAREEYWIAYYKARFPKMLNVSPGGNVPPSCDPRVAAKISAALRGRVQTEEHRRNGALARIGFQHSEETKAKMRKPKTAEHRENARLALNAKRDAGEYRKMFGDANPMRKYPDLVLRGASSRLAKLTEEEVLRMRELFSTGTPATELGRSFGISTVNARRIVLGLTWAHLPGACEPRGQGRRGFAAPASF